MLILKTVPADVATELPPGFPVEVPLAPEDAARGAITGASSTGMPGTVRRGVLEMLREESCDSASDVLPPKQASFSSRITVRRDGFMEVRSNSIKA